MIPTINNSWKVIVIQFGFFYLGYTFLNVNGSYFVKPPNNYVAQKVVLFFVVFAGLSSNLKSFYGRQNTQRFIAKRNHWNSFNNKSVY